MINKIYYLIFILSSVSTVNAQFHVDTLLNAELITKYEENNNSKNWTGKYVILANFLDKENIYQNYSKGLLIEGKRDGLWRYYNYNGQYILKYEYEFNLDTILRVKEYHNDTEILARDARYISGHTKDVIGYNPNGTKKYQRHLFNYKSEFETDEIQITYYQSGQVKSVMKLRRFVDESKVTQIVEIGDQHFYNSKGELYLLEEYDNEGNLLNTIEFNNYEKSWDY